MAKGEFKLTNPDGVEASLTLTMTIGEWKRLSAAITEKGYPAWTVNDLIWSLVRDAEKHFCKSEPEPTA